MTVADLDALALIAYTGGRTKKGTGPRFKLSDAENDMVVHISCRRGPESCSGAYRGLANGQQMKPKQEARPSPVSLRRAIANLLRFADIDLRDARMLTRRGSLRDAVVLIRSAMDHLIAAILVSERSRGPTAWRWG